MHSYIKVLAIAILAAGLYSCAQEVEVASRTYEDRIMDAYVQQHPEWKDAEKSSSGLFSKVLNEGAGTTPAITDWVMVKFTGKTLEGDYFHTTDSSVFKTLDYHVNYFHIVPDFLYMAGSMPQGFREALLKMKEGGKVDLLIPSYLGFGSYGAVKFGQMPLLPNAYVQPNRPVTYSMELVKVVKKPAEYDSLMVDAYVKSNAGYANMKDKKVYMKEITKGSTAPEDTIGANSTAYVFYATYFLDELVHEKGLSFDQKRRPFCIDTNIDEIADIYAPFKANYNVGQTGQLVKNDTLKVVYGKDGKAESTTEGFALAIKELSKGSEADVVLTSSYAYGMTGKSSSSFKPSIGPFTPLRFYIKVVKVVNPKPTTTKSAMLPPALLRKN